MAEIDRRLAVFNRFDVILPVRSAGIAQTEDRPRSHAAGTAIAAGKNLTTAAVDSGFASPSHLADRFKATFGLSATQLLGTGAILRTP